MGSVASALPLVRAPDCHRILCCLDLGSAAFSKTLVICSVQVRDRSSAVRIPSPRPTILPLSGLHALPNTRRTKH